ncbi:hypothetical protein [Pseudanabaena sp. BC1403]|uniref:hypothetical protein n=1 Tax=Pseudanabaena sp. BC1403 TaxID=2043171 RepID=UPI000CD8E3A1|nr:hypothetical protein [Pseudanabaena sp. BC1403]
MRGAARIGGRAFRPAPSSAPRDEFNPLEALDLVGDLPVAPTLEPINDEWSWSLGAEPADPRDCSRYPASPYCGEIPASTIPFGYEPEIKTNGCETCLYVYPVILWLKVTPQVICRRDPNCDVPKPTLNKDELSKHAPKPFDENVRASAYKSPECAARESITNYFYNRQNELAIAALTGENIGGDSYEFRNQKVEYMGTRNLTVGTGEIVDSVSLELHLAYPISVYDTGAYIYHYIGDLQQRIDFVRSGERRRKGSNDEWTVFGNSVDLRNWKPIPCPDRPRPPKILPPPPFGGGGGGFGGRKDKDKKRGKDMCCNDCADSKENTEKLLRELKEIKKVLGTGKLEKALNAAVGIGDDSITAIVNLIAKRLGTSAYPIEVPQSLLQGLGDGTQKMESNAEFLHWLTYQIDSLVGQFPVDIDVKDIDPLKEGEQKKTIQIPNIAEAIAEMYALTLKSSVNQEVELNMLLRLAAEIIATKNASVVAQDYARANATFLGYKANYKPRELQYNFDFTGASLDPRSKEPIVLEKLLKTVTGYVQGWEIADKETVVGFLQKLMFSAGIIKAVFFRGKGQQKELNREISAMTADETAQEEKFEAFIKEINDPNSRFNKNAQDKPEIKDETPPDTKKGGAK